MRQNRLPELTQEIEKSLEKTPAWLGGKALLAVISARTGKAERAKSLLEELLADKKNQIPPTACWIVAQEIENNDATRPLAVKLYESTLEHAESRELEFSYSPLRRLVGLYQKAGQKTKAFDLVMKLSHSRDYSQYPADYAASRRVEQASSLGQQLIDLGYPLDAIRIFNEVLDNDELLQNTRQNGDYYLQRAREGYAKARAAVTAESLKDTIGTLLTPRVAVESGGAAVDLVLLVSPRELDRAALESMLARPCARGRPRRLRKRPFAGKWPISYVSIRMISRFRSPPP